MYSRPVFVHVLCSLLLLVVQGTLQTALAADASSSSKRPRNTVVVSAHKGDYADPIAAAKNALSGDRWCVSPQLPKHPCVMKILPGPYVLPETLRVPAGVALQGTETRSVLLLAGRGVSVGVISEGPLVADLSVVSDEPGGTALAFNQKLQRTAIAARGYALTDLARAGIGHLAANFDISDTEIVSSGAAISADNGSSLKVRDSRITGVGGVMQFSDVHSIKLKDTHVTSRGEQQGFPALSVNNGIYGDVEIKGGSITSAAGAAISLIDMFGSFLMVGTQVNGGVGLDNESADSFVFDGVSITAPAVAIGMSVLGPGTETRNFVVRSFLNAPTALSVSSQIGPEPLSVQESFIGGAIRGFDTPVRITRSVLIGSLQGEDLSCKNVYDQNYVLLKNTCPVQ